MARFYITKSDGNKEFFQDKKLLGSLLKSSLNREDAKEVISEIKSEAGAGITSGELHAITYKKLCKAHLPQAQLYNLRKALADLPPKTFEKFVIKILTADGYTCEWEKIVTGAGTRHEVDVVASKKNDCYLIECKRRSNWHKPSGLGKVLIVRARFEDICEGHKKGKNRYAFNKAWLINNAKFSAHAREYAAFKGIWLTGWGYPEDRGINEWIQHLQVYPITMLRLQNRDITALLTKEIITFSDFEGKGKTSAKRLLHGSVFRSAEKQIQLIRQCTI